MANAYYVAYTVLVAIPIVVLLPLFISSLWTVPQGKDTARRGFRWMKIALGLMLIGTILITASAAEINRLIDWDSYITDPDDYYRREEIINRVGDWSYLFLQVALQFTFLATLEVALGILYCWDAGRRARTVIQWAAYAFVLVESLFTLVIMGYWESYYTALFKYIRNDRSGDGYPDGASLFRLYNVQATYSILLGVAATALLGLAVVVVVRARKYASHRQTAVLVLVASLFFWISSLWNMVTAILVYLEEKHIDRRANLIVDPILSEWFVAVTLALLFIAGRRRLGGLWSKGEHVSV
ncbi:hypothetical protein PFICI_10232 [Pestalotiopsis fici W106-1]|uniref:Uncharacterized protein n=1 Tax=Pestalotiopsis fici (strain W106-1 / CGMCC3.15140) TaxID=1229662 RepID=W3WWE8_PESFW|nr:uncharacterized protein PFICI_10232 [Pestalotiopsis fici W106-1]ETS78170.1 hypothetical protein PFICI_10232 [Pestalotiopsis fici W106-1]